MAVSMKMAVFWVVMPCSLVKVGLVNFYQATWRYNPEDSHLHVAMIQQNFANIWI
jgi:hypothetical protein